MSSSTPIHPNTRTDCVEEKRVVIIIPTYNEASVIQETISQVFKAVASLDEYSLSILIFDSNSQDETQSLVKQMQSQYSNLHLVGEKEKTGLGSAYLQAMHYAMDILHADIIFEYDADLSHQPKHIPGFLEELKRCDSVVGSRYVPGGSIPKNWQFHRKLLSVLGNYVARFILTPRYKDFTSGFRATRCSVLKKVLPVKFLSNHYAYKLQLLWLLHKARAKIHEYPIEFVDRNKGESKLPRNSIIDSLRVIFCLRAQECKVYFKMCLVGSLGIFLQFFIYNILRCLLLPFYASTIAVFAAIINNFTLNSRFTFKKNVFKNDIYCTIKQFTGFILYSLVMIFLQSTWLSLCLRYTGQGLLKENIILALGIILASFLNYYVYSRRIWPEPHSN